MKNSQGRSNLRGVVVKAAERYHYAIIWLVLIGFVGWLIGAIAGQDPYAQILGAEPSALAMITGIVGATISCHLFLHTSPTR